MKRLVHALALLLVASSTQAQDLMITGIMDGPLTGGQPKFVELRALSDIADLSVYSIANANNGNSFGASGYTLSGSMASGEYLYITSDDGAEFQSYFGFAADFTNVGNLNVNGDDVVGLRENGTLIDVYGVEGVDGTGEAWDYVDGWAYSTVGRTPGTTFDAAEWTYSGPDATDGCTTNASCDSPFPSTNPIILPVELVSFDAAANGSGATLRWATASETNNAGFEVQQQAGASWKTLGFLPGNGTTLEAQSYAFDVRGLTAGTYRFRLRQVDFDGAFEFSPEVELTVALTNAYALDGAQPNPARDRAAFTLSVQRSQQVTVELYNLLGQRVSTLFAGRMADNESRTIEIAASSLPAGVYVYRVQGETFASSRQVTVIR